MQTGGSKTSKTRNEHLDQTLLRKDHWASLIMEEISNASPPARLPPYWMEESEKHSEQLRNSKNLQGRKKNRTKKNPHFADKNGRPRRMPHVHNPSAAQTSLIIKACSHPIASLFLEKGQDLNLERLRMEL